MNIRLGRIAVGALVAELLAVASLFLIIPIVVVSRPPSLVAAEPIIQGLADWFGPIGGLVFCLLGGRWVARKLATAQVVNGLILGAVAAGLYIVLLVALGAPFRVLFVLAILGRLAAGATGGWLASRARKQAPANT